MDKFNEIPGFLPEDYDKDPSDIEDANLKANHNYWLHHNQVVIEDSAALEEGMSAEFDSFIALGFRKEKHEGHTITEHELACGACHIDSGDYDAISELQRLLGYYAFKYPEMGKILDGANVWRKSLHEAEDNPEPPEHKYLPRDERFHQNRYDRILSEELDKVYEKFCELSCEDKLRYDMRMRMVLTAIADQLNDNEPVEIDFFCNFVLREESIGNKVSGIDIRLRPYPCTWDEADANRARFIELCKQYDVPCHIEWLQD